MTASLIFLHLGDTQHFSDMILAMLRTLETRMLGLLGEAVELSAEAQIDKWTQCWTFHTID